MVEDAGYTSVEAVDGDQDVAIMESQIGASRCYTRHPDAGAMDGLGLRTPMHARWPDKIILVRASSSCPAATVRRQPLFSEKPKAAK